MPVVVMGIDGQLRTFDADLMDNAKDGTLYLSENGNEVAVFPPGSWHGAWLATAAVQPPA